MRIFDIAIKDMRRTFQSVFSIVMMFGAPLLITGLLYFAFGGLSDGAAGFSLPVTKVQVANLDQPDAHSGGLAAGEMLVEFLQNEELAGVMEIGLAPDEASARSAVDSQKAGVALVIPPDFSAAALAPDRETRVTLYQDPTLTIGPMIVKNMASHFMDGFSGSKIAAEAAMSGVSAHGGEADGSLAGEAAEAYVAWLESSGHGSALNVVSPTGLTPPANQGPAPIGPIMAGMIIFFVFFMGANGAESIIREDEEGTLRRLFTTPASQPAILGGKFLGVLVSLMIQILLLLIASAMLFGIQWGKPATVALVSFGLIVASAGFGVMLMSFVKNSRQIGPVMGGVLTLTGMLGGLFTNGIPNIPAAFDKVTLITPHGWALQGWKLALSGANPDQVFATVLVMFAMGLAFFAVGIALFRKRFA
jgi:ABC-2 type transport system permease protein